MSKTASFVDLGFVRLSRRKNESLAEQLYETLRCSILSGQLSKGYRLPSSRALATDLGVSRTTIITAFDQLTAEGYLRGNVGRGTFVSDQLPEDRELARFQGSQLPNQQRGDKQIGRRLYSRRGRQFSSSEIIVPDHVEDLRPFRPGVPALDQFPIAQLVTLGSKPLEKSVGL